MAPGAVADGRLTLLQVGVGVGTPDAATPLYTPTFLRACEGGVAG